MTPAEFAAKWFANTRAERAAAQEHFIDLCQMLGVPTPNSDPHGTDYAFEKGAEKTGGGDGWADVWKRGHFAWEYKGKHRDLAAAYGQLLKYREALDNPPLLVVSDMDRFEIHTNFTNTAPKVHVFTLADLAERPSEPLRLLRALFSDPDSLRPDLVRELVTQKAAAQFARLARSLRERGIEGPAVAHFLDRVLFCMFAEDAGLLPRGLLTRLVENLYAKPEDFNTGLASLFDVMAHEGGTFGTDWIDWFDGGLFDDAPSIPLRADEIRVIRDAAELEWASVEPAIFGTLFERGLDPDKRSQLGAHYTDRASIERLVEATVMMSLRRDFSDTRASVEKALEGTFDPAALEEGRHAARALLERLRAVTVLDPACGSGNFLYLALRMLKDLEHDVLEWAAARLRLPSEATQIGPRSLRGIEINTYAAELARIVIWIGEIQWLRDHGHPVPHNPILPTLDVIEKRDAILDLSDPSHPIEPDWPDATFIVGNPPFLGAKKLRGSLGSDYVEALFNLYGDRLPGMSDLVAYWFEKARAMVASGRTQRAGLLATQGIRGGLGRRVLERIRESGDIFMARSDDEWVLDGASVHVSFVAFDDGSERERTLDGLPVAAINANLTADVDLTTARRLPENLGIAFIGDQKSGPFDVQGTVARDWLRRPNPDGRDNREVVRPWVNGLDLTGRPRDMWIVDFGASMTREEAALYETPFEHTRRHVLPAREASGIGVSEWWLHWRPRPEMREALAGLTRFLATARVARHRMFVWTDAGTLVDSATVAIARDDDFTFGILQSRVHTTWARHMGTQLREAVSGSRYTPTTCFETFPFPILTDAQRAAIATAAVNLDHLRQGWLNPERTYDITPRELAHRTLTNLYNQNPTWLVDAHAHLDDAVLDSYGWPNDIGDEELLRRLLELNLRRADEGSVKSAS